MENRFSPLVLPAQLHLFPDNYAQGIRQFEAEGYIIAQQHLDRVLDFIDLEEVDYEDVKMMLFAQFFLGDVRKWFRGFLPNSIVNFQAFGNAFLRKWEDRKNPLQLLTQYNNMKRYSTDIV